MIIRKREKERMCVGRSAGTSGGAFRDRVFVLANGMPCVKACREDACLSVVTCFDGFTRGKLMFKLLLAVANEIFFGLRAPHRAAI